MVSLGTWREDLVRIRRDLHAYPELGFEEHRTSALVAERLKAFGVDEVHTGIGRTGVVGRIYGRTDNGRSIGLRADMDGLPIHEKSGVSHASTIDGRMHACGHDGHVAILLGAARYLAGTRNFDGSVTLIFQPGEEGYAGAREMVNDGLFERFPVDTIFALHNWPSLPLGKVIVNPGPIMAARDDFWIEIQGAGAHGALPHLGVDPIVAASQVIAGLQTIVSRNVNPNDAAVVTVHSIKAGGDTTFGVLSESVTIPGRLNMSGIAKWFDPEVGDVLERRIAALTTDLCKACGAEAQVEYQRFLPATINDATAAEAVLHAAFDVVGTSNVRTDVAPSMASEDFSFMLQERPGAYFLLGTGNEHSHALHSPRFDFNDDALPMGCAIFNRLVERELGA